jgi:hypothetical protein
VDDYLVIVFLFNVFVFVIYGALGLAKERRDLRRFREHMNELTMLRAAMQNEGLQLRSFLELQEARRLRSRAREAHMKLHAPGEDDAQGRIAVNRMLDVDRLGYEGVTGAEISAAIETMTDPKKVPED